MSEDFFTSHTQIAPAVAELPPALVPHNPCSRSQDQCLPTSAEPSLLPSPGDARWQKRNRGAVRHQNPEEGRGDPGWRRGVHHGGEAGAGTARQAPVPDAAALLLPDSGKDRGFCLMLSLLPGGWVMVPRPSHPDDIIQFPLGTVAYPTLQSHWRYVRYK